MDLKLARAVNCGEVDFARLKEQPDGEVIEAMVALPGIGRWTREMSLTFSLGKAECPVAQGRGLSAHGQDALPAGALTAQPQASIHGASLTRGGPGKALCRKHENPPIRSGQVRSGQVSPALAPHHCRGRPDLRNA